MLLNPFGKKQGKKNEKLNEKATSTIVRDMNILLSLPVPTENIKVKI
jgi:hypothetical protein